MRKKVFKFIIIIAYFLITLYTIYSSLQTHCFNKYELSTNNKAYINIKTIEIPKISLSSNIIRASDNFDNLDYSLVYYKNFNPYNKIIIFGHSGMGAGTYFNRLNELDKKDLVYIRYNKKSYKYVVKKVYKVSKYDIHILDEEENSKKLLLVTCTKFNKNKRLVVELFLKSIKNVEK